MLATGVDVVDDVWKTQPGVVRRLGGCCEDEVTDTVSLFPGSGDVVVVLLVLVVVMAVLDVVRLL